MRRRAPTPEPVFYHGGVAGLVAAEFILPGGEVDPDENDAEFCFITTDLLEAWFFALVCEDKHGAAELYLVRPIGHLWPAHSEGGVNFACRRALILGRYHIPNFVRAAWQSDRISFLEEIQKPWWDSPLEACD